MLKRLKDLSEEQLRERVQKCTLSEAQRVLDDWSLWAMPHQQWPEGDWKTWICRSGRGSGKTYMGAKWCHDVAENASPGSEIGIIAQTHQAVKDVCIQGPSGILATAPAHFRPTWSPGNKILKWPNGVIGKVMSADKPSSIRGSQFIFIWCDEMAFWQYPETTWTHALFPAVRATKLSGMRTRILVTTTPVPDKFLRELEKKKNVVLTRSSTYQNKWLSEDTLKGYEEEYKNNPKAERQELYGEFVEDNENALWGYDVICRNRITQDQYDQLVINDKILKIVVAVDPAGSVNKNSDETGIIVAAVCEDGHFYVIEDLSGKYKPEEWAQKAIDAYSNYQANLIIAEKTYGGDMVESVIRALDEYIPIKLVNALKSKRLRAEPVATIYTKNIVHHVGTFKDLEEQQTDWVPGKASPDRLDALVYAILNLHEEKPTLNLYKTNMIRRRR